MACTRKTWYCYWSTSNLLLWITTYVLLDIKNEELKSSKTHPWIPWSICFLDHEIQGQFRSPLGREFSWPFQDKNSESGTSCKKCTSPVTILDNQKYWKDTSVVSLAVEIPLLHFALGLAPLLDHYNLIILNYVMDVHYFPLLEPFPPFYHSYYILTASLLHTINHYCHNYTLFPFHYFW